MWLTLLLLACARDGAPAASGSRSADLSLRAAEVSRRADSLAERTRDLEGLFDQLREADADGRAALRRDIRSRALELQEEARALRDEVADIEAASRVYAP